MNELNEMLLRCWLMLTGPRVRDERGDVPGWVMIVVMTAALVGVIYALAQDQLNQLLTDALSNVIPSIVAAATPGGKPKYSPACQ